MSGDSVALVKFEEDETEWLRALAARLRKPAPLYEDIEAAADNLDAFVELIEICRAGSFSA